MRWGIPRGEVPTLSDHIHLSLCNNVPWKKSWKIFHFVNKITLHVLESLRQDQLLNLWSPLLKSSEFQASDSRASNQVAPCHCTGCNACDVSWAQHSQENQIKGAVFGENKEFFPQFCPMGFHSFMARIWVPGTTSRARGVAVKYGYHLYPRVPATLLRALPVIIFIIWPNYVLAY